MTPPRVLVVIGTRPEGIKLAPVVTELERLGEVQVAVALTGQHTDLIDQVLHAFDLTVHWDLGIMREGQSLYDVAQGCLSGLRPVLTDFKPDLTLVQGDTGSVLFGALASFFERTLVGHVEAGLRSGSKWQPYPEEVFRRMTGVVADLHFAPTPGARANLLREGVPAEQVFLTGNTVIDAVRAVAAAEGAPESEELRSVLRDERRFVLVTIHRRESFGEPIRRAFMALRDAADEHPDLVFFYPVHPNPEVRRPAADILTGHPGIRLAAPLGYVDLVRALEASVLVLTDSGGIQEEAPTFGTPVLVLREVTERPEAVEAGLARLVGTDRERILAGIRDLVAPASGAAGRGNSNPYGDGRAAERIGDIVGSRLTGRERRTSDWSGKP